MIAQDLNAGSLDRESNTPPTVLLCPISFVIATNNYITFISQRLFCIMISLR